MAGSYQVHRVADMSVPPSADVTRGQLLIFNASAFTVDVCGLAEEPDFVALRDCTVASGDACPVAAVVPGRVLECLSDAAVALGAAINTQAGGEVDDDGESTGFIIGRSVNTVSAAAGLVHVFIRNTPRTAIA